MKIEKGIPIPKRRNGLTEFMRGMKVGDSALVPFSLGVHAQAGYAKIKVVTRPEKGKMRIWRTK